MAGVPKTRVVVACTAITALLVALWLSVHGIGRETAPSGRVEPNDVSRPPRASEIEIRITMPEPNSRVKTGVPVAFRGELRATSPEVQLRETDPVVVANEMQVQGRFATLESFVVKLTRRDDGAFEFHGMLGEKTPARKAGPYRIRARFAGVVEPPGERSPKGDGHGPRPVQPTVYMPYEVTP